MKKNTALLLALGYLEFSYDDFQQYLEEEQEIEATEAEIIIEELNSMHQGRKSETTTRNKKIRRHQCLLSH